MWISITALFVSILSLGLTAYKLWTDYKENLLNISVHLKNHYIAHGRHVIEANFVNNTKNVVSITRIALVNEKHHFTSEENRVLLTKTKHIRNESTPLPINLNSYSSIKAFIVFDTKYKIDDCVFKIFTSKGVCFTEQKMKVLKEQRLLNLAQLRISK
ncbi:hypothetical protein [Staphylococcus schleiferi]|uniref:hypothetical protein n=1 Tax=Staphylococcus schleiferi TaxID=1295 RepID=UPI0021CF144F|nr:hypothetical protein [Staphylococcus schleiferi]UXR54511.1 hypothetical protein MUA46_09660 [Staphylococcus schleiferi]UXR56818.1 hypothetical protein MUA40_09400 [Staphylococcus schleiferi]UXR59102.1 hypothetical protein MUA91_09400 [Staphylococcus schleiferi]UXR61417.1 hypothetical protein MUA72_09630 [Staphylococcus schleiferi]